MRLLLFLCAAALAVAPASAQTPAPGDVVINEIAYDPPAPQASTNEWVEVANRSAGTVSLEGLVFSDGSTDSQPLGAAVLAPGELLTLVRNETEFQTAYPGVPYLLVASFPALNNSGDTPQLRDGATVIDAVPYLPSWGGTDASLERIDVDGPSDQASNFGTTTDPDFGTPGETNSIAGTGGGDTTPPDLTGASASDATTVLATFNEALDPTTAQNAGNYSIDGGIGAPAAAVLSGQTVTLTLGAPLTPGQTYTLTVSNIQDVAGNVLASDSETFTAAGDGDPTLELVINEFLYDPPTAQDAGEYVELFNRSTATVDLAGYTLNDATGDDEPITADPTPVAPGEYVVVVQDGTRFAAVFPGVAFIEQDAWSALNNTGDDIVLRRPDGALVDRLSYTPADWGGSDVAVERIDADGPSDTPANWAEAEGTLGTPGALNTASGGTGGDTTPPDLESATPTTATTLVVLFSEALDPASAETVGNYAVDGGIGAPASAALVAPETVELTFATPFTAGQPYTLTVQNVEDVAGNASGTQTADFTFFGAGDVPELRDLVINEFLYDPPSAQDAGEYVELFNRSDKTFDLREFTLQDATDTADPVTDDPDFVGPGEYVVIVDDPAKFAAVFPGVPFIEQPAWNALNNGGDQIRLKYQGAVVDSLQYVPSSWGGSDVALERRDPNGPSSTPANWAEADGVLGTPGAQNSQFGSDTQGPLLVEAEANASGTQITVQTDEPLDPASVPGAFSVSGATVTSADYDGEQTVVLTLGAPLATGTVTVTATNLRDLIGNVTPSSSTSFDFQGDDTPPGVLSANALSPATVRLVFSEPVTAASASPPATYDVAGQTPTEVVLEANDAGVLSVVLTLATPLADGQYTATATGLVDLAGNVGGGSAPFFVGEGDVPEPRDLVINEFLYDPPSAQDAGEYIELFNRSDKTFDLSDFTLQDATDTADPVSNTPAFVGPGEYVVIVDNPAKFTAVFPGVPFIDQPSWNALNNSEEQIRLKYEGVVIDSLLYVPAIWGGVDVALERRDPNGPSSAPANWADAAGVLGTPGAINSQFGPDEQGPTLISATADRAGLVVTVTLDEPIDPASLDGAFTVNGTAVATADYDGGQTVTLGLAAPLQTGTVTVTATDLRDTLGNITSTTAVQFEFVRDATPPGLASAFVSSPTTVVVRFTEPVTRESAESVGTYQVESLGMPQSVTAVSGTGGIIGATLAFETAFEERRLYTLTVSGLVDLAGNVQTEPATATLFFGQADTPAAGQLVLNEIQYDPLVGSTGEYVELLNTTETRVFDLGALSLDGGEPDDDPVTDGPTPVPPGAHVAIVRDGEAFAAAFPGAPFVVADNFQSLSNSGAPLVLRDLASGLAVDSVAYDPDWHRVELDDATGISLERRDPAGPSNDASNWTSSLDSLGGTPGRLNSVSVLAGPPPASAGLEITSPFAPDEGESARIAYTLSTEAALVRARIFDGGGRQVRELESGRFGGASGFLSWDGRDDRGERLRIGIYIVLLDAVDAQGGTSESFRDVVVLGRR